MKLNLGCGHDLRAGYCNVDLFGSPDLVWDLESFPWPWANDSIEEVVLSHTLEHLGRTTDSFILIMKELYRVCADGALVHITVPHPRHDFYLADPTHVRPILPLTLEMFSRAANLRWKAQGASNTTLALYHGVDFELVSTVSKLEEPYRSLYAQGQIAPAQLQELELSRNNVITEVDMTLRVIKSGAAG